MRSTQGEVASKFLIDGAVQWVASQRCTYYCRRYMLEDRYTAHKTWFGEHNKNYNISTRRTAAHGLDIAKAMKGFEGQWAVHRPWTYMAFEVFRFRKLYTSIVATIKSQSLSNVRTMLSLSFGVVSIDHLESFDSNLVLLTKTYMFWK